jgi:hypothetical protein
MLTLTISTKGMPGRTWIGMTLIVISAIKDSHVDTASEDFLRLLASTLLG